ncbi:hypothetical protein BJV82DRAFT_618804 [Fennellomyces sp. T-0311]|nr:hypothetical protein BJV82DRAFT_618804 [Fennellomyces sp. T-0311]
MGLFDHFSSQKQEYDSKNKEEHEGSFTHELIAGAGKLIFLGGFFIVSYERVIAAFEAAKAYNEHCEKNGKPVDHATAKQLLAGLAGGLVDKLVETKGLDAIDRIKAKRHAEDQLNKYYDEEHA